jgi:hypothetical protein
VSVDVDPVVVVDVGENFSATGKDLGAVLQLELFVIEQLGFEVIVVVQLSSTRLCLTGLSLI